MKIKEFKLFRDKCFINGEFCNSESGEVFTVLNPVDNSVIGSIPSLSQAEVEKSIKTAKQSFSIWRDTSVYKRKEILTKWHSLMMQNKEELAQIMTIEQGKPIREARIEIEYAATFLLWYAEEAVRTYGSIIESPKPDQKIFVEYEAVGVVGAITPWNFPSAMITRKIAPALAAGCSVVLKPSELTPYSAMAHAILLKEAGLPDGVFNIITGDAAMIGEVFTKSEDISKISFTGSTRVGRILFGNSGETIKKLSLELGGNAPFIVFDDANLEKSVAGAIAGKFRNTGQTCIAVNRIYVHKSLHDEFVRMLKEKVSAMKTGNGLDEKTDLGPLINPAAITKITSLIEDAKAKGGKVILGGKKMDIPGNFLEPTIITIDYKTNPQIKQEEIFGPVFVIYQFETDEEVIAEANNTIYGLASYFYTSSQTRSWNIAKKLQYGMVGINDVAISQTSAPFGGVKQSGLGREGSFMGIMEYLSVKYINLNIN